MNQNQSEYLTATEAIQLLDVSKGKMAKLLRTGEIPYISDPRNERAKLIRRSDIDAWLKKAVRPKRPHQGQIPSVTSGASRKLLEHSGDLKPPGPDDPDPEPEP